MPEYTNENTRLHQRIAQLEQQAEASTRQLASTTAALQHTDQFLQLLVETTAEGIWVINAAEQTTFVNERMAYMLGCTTAAMHQQPLSAFLNEQSRTIFQHRASMTPGAPHDPVCLQRTDGSEL
jgi:PAS domain-containing protein